ncbi:helix-turn-helix domain-containing protein [Aureispira sp. CCB-QB1]|uniref:helix-turn-helix domain-containing protein n=1 Tax=Aureispira sp. CCB-QB1 TaxID=1313421 RepID=UPI000698A400|nr:helix-turn-helix domain-containing protein [Aureispira sp. CCB-QB1]
MKGKENKKIAKTLFIELGLSQADIALRLKISRQQISKWVTKENWKVLRNARLVTSEQIVQRTYVQIGMIYEKSEEEERILTSTESDQIAKLMAGIRSLDRGADLATYIQAFEEFVNFMRKQDPELAQRIGDYQMEFLTIKASELSKN